MADRTAMVFPGMAPSGFATLGKFLVLDRFARERVAEASEVLGYPLLARLRADGEDGYSADAQVAFVVSCLALADRAEQVRGVRADVVACPSFGQKAAAVYTGALSFADAVRFTVDLARCEEEYFAGSDLVTHCVVRVPEEAFHDVLRGMAERGEWYDVSGHLDRGFHLVSLSERHLDAFIADIRAAGGYSMHTMRPPVHAAAFTPLRHKAEAEVFTRYTIGAPRIPVVADQDGALVETADAMRTMLLDTFDRAIRWPDVVAGLRRLDVGTVVFAGQDNLFHRLDVTAEAFRVVALNPKNALLPPKTARSA
ncbi:ACP S-malonyltransferase [Saccharothrix australiensis]|uniref:[acyl-carrier-protein] S-malonyltransferase n=1 Tax=Saccharothrix australiensis TaxID=2072 RepID=A0A495VYH6_9PSEU|nr:ACP S-malonyltransferase [Saccharothrix australiensis]RKT54481.1 [acyl-carrier-protein] S-malonyltransferase [Saccharothrix australiensis]